jgi:glycosyltransferase involved in cell wall biosynthesis
VKIRILYIIDQLLGLAGTEKHLYSLVRCLDKNLFDPWILCFEARNEVLRYFRPYARVFNLEMGKIYDHRAISRFTFVVGLIKKIRPDIVQTFHFKSDTYGVVASRFAGVPCVISSRRDSADLKRERQIVLSRIANAMIDHFIMVCRKVMENQRRKENIPLRKMSVIYNGVDYRRFASGDNYENRERIRNQLKIRENEIVIGVCAIFRPEKGYDVFLKAIGKLKEEIDNFKVLICGDGQLRKKYEVYCSENNLKSIIHFAGYVSDVEAYLSAMDIFCFVPVKNEGFSNALLEAMASGKAIVASDVGGNTEAIIDDHSGIIVPPKDHDSLVKALMRLIRDQELRGVFANNAKKRALFEFNLEKMIKKHEELYCRLIDS